jgi:hypothetical protein
MWAGTEWAAFVGVALTPTTVMAAYVVRICSTT